MLRYPREEEGKKPLIKNMLGKFTVNDRVMDGPAQETHIYVHFYIPNPYVNFLMIYILSFVYKTHFNRHFVDGEIFMIFSVVRNSTLYIIYYHHSSPLPNCRFVTERLSRVPQELVLS